MRKKIFVIGAMSVFAKDVISDLSKDYDVVTGGRADCDVYCDVTKKVSIPDKTEIVINFAVAFGGDSDEEIVKAVKTNTEGALNVCIAAKGAEVKHVINISSASVVIKDDSVFKSIYGITKRQADELTQFYCSLNKLALSILRPSQIYGDSDDFAKQQPFFYLMIDKAQAGEDIILYGKHDPVRNYIHVNDLIDIIKLVIQKKLEGTYLCVYPEDITYSQIAETAQRVFGNGGRVLFLKNKPNIRDKSFGFDDTIYKKLNWSPQVTLEKGLTHIKEYREAK